MDKQIVVREAVATDKTEFMNLWSVCFGDSQSFMDWMFETRFYPKHSVCLFEGTEMCSAMQGVPYTILVRGKRVLGMMLCGVSTHPNHRKRGFMGRIFKYEMELLRRQGVILAVHTPAVLPSYFSYGHHPVADGLYVQGSVKNKVSAAYTKLEKNKMMDAYPLYVQEIGTKYSGVIVRSKEEFLRKYDDYAADGGQCIVVKENEMITGYAMFYETEKELIAVEVVAQNGVYAEVIEALLTVANGKKINAKLPPDVHFTKDLKDGLYLEQKQKGVAGICNIQKLFAILELDCPHAIEIYDHIVKENNGIFDFTGKASNKQPALKIEAGRMLGVLMGYVSLNEIKEDYTIYQNEEVEQIAKLLTKENCYIIDEY